MVIISLYAAWNGFSLCKRLGGGRRDLSGLDCPGEPHSSLYPLIYCNTKYSSYIGFQLHFGTFSLCLLGQVSLWDNAAPA